LAEVETASQTPLAVTGLDGFFPKEVRHSAVGKLAMTELEGFYLKE
jgi:hypothetical protein